MTGIVISSSITSANNYYINLKTGNIDIYSSGSQIKLGNECMITLDDYSAIQMGIDGKIRVTNFDIYFDGYAKQDVTIKTNLGAGIAILNFTSSNTEHAISFNYNTVDYLIIDKTKIIYGSGSTYSYNGQSIVLVVWVNKLKD